MNIEQMPAWVKALVVAIFAVLIVVVWPDSAPRSEAERADRQAERTAKTACADRIRDDASVPSSVAISWATGARAARFRDGWKVQLDFEADNRLGATLPHRALCIINADGDVMSYTADVR